MTVITWQSMGLASSSYSTVSAIAIAPGNGDMILVGIGAPRGVILKSTDGGQSWKEKKIDISLVTDLVFDPEDTNTVYAATEGMGILISRDQGETWNSFNEGIFYPMVYDLAVSEKGQSLILAGSFGSGAYLYPLWDCSGDDLVIENMVFMAGSKWECNGTSSITVGPGIMVEPYATVLFRAPTINLKAGVTVKEGADFRINP